MREIWGVLPALGRRPAPAGRRGPSVEIRPLAAPDGGERLVCQDLFDNLRLAGVHRALVLLRPGRLDIARRLGDGSALGVELAYRVLAPRRGLPFALARADPFLGDRFAALGLPAALLAPRDLLARLLRHHERTQADVALALAPGPPPEGSSGIEADARGRVRRIARGPGETDFRSCWALALWSPRFTRFLVQWCESFNPRSARLGREPTLGDVLAAAHAAGIAIESLSVPEARIVDASGAPPANAR
jgi:glucose-1-phosphate thymidylyltransferase